MARTKRKAAKANNHNGVNPLKTRLRDLRRMLAHAKDMPADIRIGHEREVATCEQDLAATVKEAQVSNTIKKYHMVRFFERQKATRFLAQARRRLDQATDEDAKTLLVKDVHNRNVDLNYTMYFPLKQAYSSLYKDSTENSGSEEGKVNRSHPIWKGVEDAGVVGKLQELRDGPSLASEASITKGKARRRKEKNPVKDQKDISIQSKGRKADDDENMDADMDDGNGEALFET